MRKRSRRNKRHVLRKRRTYKQKQRGGAATPTFHVLIRSGGRPSVKRMLDSLRPQLVAGDAVTLVFDGPAAFEKSGYSPSWIKGFHSKVNVITHPTNLGHWGHGIANEYQGKLAPETTFVMHADDDDQYLPGAFDILRKKCVNPECLYIARMRNKDGLVIPRDSGPLRFANIGTPNGIIPFSKRDEAKWGLHFGGDFNYYLGLSSKVKCIEHIIDVIYEVIHDQGEANPTAP